MRGVVSSGIAIGAAIGAQVIWQNLATVLTTAAGWAQRKASPEQRALDELTYRLRHQEQVTAAEHGGVSLRRKADRRAAER